MNNDEITQFLFAILIVLVVILFILLTIFLVLKIKLNKNNKKDKTINKVKDKATKSNSQVNTLEYNKQSIFDFMEFDKIEDNMIITKNGNKFIMAIECQGVNYDLMSGIEKNSVEQGFLQFLNTLRYPIQIYVQTRTVNLESGIIKYREKINEVKNRLIQKRLEYNRLQAIDAPKEEIQKVKMELTKEENLYEYGVDIVENTEKMSLNKNILRKHYYVLISYIPEEINSNDFGKEEISSMAFSELYTRAHSIINALTVCGISSKVLNSNELAKLLYIAYNRDDSELYDLDKALNARYDRLYSTAEDVLNKRMKAISEKINVESHKLANETLLEVMYEKEKIKKVKEKEKQMKDMINQMARNIINDNKSIIGDEMAQEAKKKLNEKKKTKKSTAEKEENK